jgi:hypothetical protein
MWTLIIASGLAALALSFQGLAGLASLMGIQPSALFPASVDVTTTAATIAWLTGGHASRAGRRLALASITASVAGNAVYHFITSASGDAVLASAVAAVPPIMLASVVHLGALLASPPVAHQQAGDAGDKAGEKLVASEDVRQEPRQEIQPPLPQPTHSQIPAPDLASRIASIRQAARDAGERAPGRQALASELGVTPHQVRTALEELAARGGDSHQITQFPGGAHQEPRQASQ